MAVNALDVSARRWWERPGFVPFDPGDPDGLDLYMLTSDMDATLSCADQITIARLVQRDGLRDTRRRPTHTLAPSIGGPVWIVRTAACAWRQRTRAGSSRSVRCWIRNAGFEIFPVANRGSGSPLTTT